MSRKKKPVNQKSVKEELQDLQFDIGNSQNQLMQKFSRNQESSQHQNIENETENANDQNNEEALDQIIQKINNLVRIDERRLQRAITKRAKYSKLAIEESDNLNHMRSQIQKKEDYYCEYIDKRKLQINELAKKIKELEDQELCLISSLSKKSGNDLSASFNNDYDDDFNIEFNGDEEEEELRFSFQPSQIRKKFSIPQPTKEDFQISKQLTALTHLKSQLLKSIQELTLKQT